jgi:mediator of RNA polymerase II transcription subunit 17, fungi type
MAPSTPISLSLRPPTYAQAAETDLKVLISRIYRQKGDLRHANTAELESEIAEKESEMDVSGDTLDEEDDDVKEDSDEKGSREYVTKHKAIMVQKVTAAMEEAQLLLDTVSLLETSFAPKVARETMSTWCKTNLPTGSVEYSKWVDMPADPAQIADDETISRGWKLRTLADSADTLLGAAKRLEADVRRETNYWGQVLSIKTSGDWPIFSNSRQRHLIGVRVASTEAGSVFRDRGIGLVKMDEDGEVYLDLPKVQKVNRLRVRIQRHGKVVGSWVMDASTADSGSDLERQAVLARDTLLDEELLFEMQQEARKMLSLGVKNRDNVVIIPGASQLEQRDDGTYFLVDVVDELTRDQEDVTSTETHMNRLARFCALSLRLLLFHHHHQRYLRRSAIQPPVAEKKRDDFEASIIKPLMRSLHHQDSIRPFKKS